MRGANVKRECYVDIEDLIQDSFLDKSVSDEKEDLVLEYLCQTISKADNYDSMKKRAQQGESYAFIQLASWHIAHAENIKDYCISHDYAKQAVKHGYTEGNYILGQLYYYGVGCEKNWYRAGNCFKRFIEEINRKKLLSDSVLVDSYLKLISIEKEQGKFDKAGFYIKKLGSEFPEYKRLEAEFEKEKKEKQQSITFYFVNFAATVLAFLIAVFLVFQCMSKITYEYAGKYALEDKVITVQKK